MTVVVYLCIFLSIILKQVYCVCCRILTIEAVIYRSIVLGGRFEAGCTSGLNVWYLNTLPIDLQTCGCNATTESLVIDPVLESSTGEYNCAFGEIWKLWVIGEYHRIYIHIVTGLVITRYHTTYTMFSNNFTLAFIFIA